MLLVEYRYALNIKRGNEVCLLDPLIGLRGDDNTIAAIQFGLTLRTSWRWTLRWHLDINNSYSKAKGHPGVLSLP